MTLVHGEQLRFREQVAQYQWSLETYVERLLGDLARLGDPAFIGARCERHPVGCVDDLLARRERGEDIRPAALHELDAWEGRLAGLGHDDPRWSTAAWHVSQLASLVRSGR